MKTVALMQPTFMPWIGYFELMKKADVFVILDDFQFVYQSFGCRNRLFINKDQVGWINIQVDKKEAYLKSYKDARIKINNGWRDKIYRTIKENYKRAPFWDKYESNIKQLFLDDYETVFMQNYAIIEFLKKILDIKCDVVFSSNLCVKGQRSRLVADILETIGADMYLSAHGSFEYMLEDGVFPLNSIEVIFQNASLKPYSQVRSTKGFIPYLSILDALLNVGEKGTNELIDNTTDHWMSWEEMLSEYKSVDKY